MKLVCYMVQHCVFYGKQISILHTVQLFSNQACIYHGQGEYKENDMKRDRVIQLHCRCFFDTFSII